MVVAAFHHGNADGAEKRVRSVLTRFAAEAKWTGRRARAVWERQVAIPRAETPTATPDRAARVRLDRGLVVPMRDGVRLSAHVFHPIGIQGPLPVVLIRQPYGKDDHPYMHARGKYWARKGYVCVVQDVRGKYGSQGKWEPFLNEVDDGSDTLDWIAGQPWCNGRIGMVGESYYGFTQWALAGLGHPNLCCIAPGNTSPDFYRTAYPGGALALMTLGEWSIEMNSRTLRNPYRFNPWHLPLISADEAAGAPSAAYKGLICHSRRDAYWDRRDVSGRGMAVPAFHWSGWYDILLDGSLAGWQAAREPSVRAERGGAQTQRLTIGPTDHALSLLDTGRVGRIAVDSDEWSFDRVQQFCDYWLRQDNNNVSHDPAVQVFVVGSNRWRSADTWPLPGTLPVSYYLHSAANAASPQGGLLSRETPGDEPSDTFVYDPDDPVVFWLSRSLWEAARQPGDRRSVEARRDVLTYSTSRLLADLEVIGPLSTTLYVSSSAPDTDFTAALVDVFPDGYGQLVQEGIVRISSLDDQDVAAFPASGVTRKLAVDMSSTGYLFRAGHRLRLEVSSSNFPRFDRNLNTGHPWGRDADRVPAVQTVYHDRRRPSVLSLLVFPSDCGTA